ncbi:MAG: hypothetical protein WED05_00210 [Candidatus Atabeyarchaeum deiterrae]
MAVMKHRTYPSRGKSRRNDLLALVLITSLMVGLLIDAQMQPAMSLASAKPSANSGPSNTSLFDPDVYLYGYHLYNVNNWYIPSLGGNFSLSLPTNWNASALGLTFFNGTIAKAVFTNTTNVQWHVTTIQQGTDVPRYYDQYNLGTHVPANSTIYQAQFTVTGFRIGESIGWVTARASTNSTYPPIDGNMGVAQSFLIANQAKNLTVLVELQRFLGTGTNITIEVRSSTSDNKVGSLIKSVTFPSTMINTGRTATTFSIPNVNLQPGSYFIVLHTQGWASSGGGYLTSTALSNRPSNTSFGWLTYNRGVNWENTVNITGSTYYFGGFKLNVRPIPDSPYPSGINLAINNIPVGDNLMWNQSIWASTPNPQIRFTSEYPIPSLNFTYKVWYYTFGTGNLFSTGYKIKVNDMKMRNIVNTTPSAVSGNFADMYTSLGTRDLQRPGVLNSSPWTINFNLKLVNSTNFPRDGSLSVVAWVQLYNITTGLSFAGPGSLRLQFIYTHSDVKNVSLSESSVTLAPIFSLTDNIYLNDSRLSRTSWLYNPATKLMKLYRDGFSFLPQYTLASGQTINCTLLLFNNFTATASASITGHLSDTTPTATIEIVNSSSLIDLEGLTGVNVTVTNTSGSVIINTAFPWNGSSYVYQLSVTGEGVYGIQVTSLDPSGYVATRWTGVVTVEDYELNAPTLSLTPSTILAPNQNLTIIGNLSYVGQPTFLFNGTVKVTIEVGTTGQVTQIVATWNSTTKSYRAIYQAPVLNFNTLLNIHVSATDSKGRISTNSTYTYVAGAASPPPPTLQPSNVPTIIIVVFVAMVLALAVSFFIDRRRRA